MLQSKKNYSRHDSLRGSNGIGRQLWNLVHYDITVVPDFSSKSIAGSCVLQFTDSGVTSLQLDLQYPMLIDSVTVDSKPLAYQRDSNVYWINMPTVDLPSKSNPRLQKMQVWFHGKPAEAVRPPWDGGWIWKTDSLGRPWMSVACQGLGASVWFPCKDYQGDEPDNGALLRIVVPDSLTAVGNGRLKKKETLPDGKKSFVWEVKNPINNYNIVPYIGKYVNFKDKYAGLKGALDLDYWCLDYHLEKATAHFRQVPRMLQAFEHWMGPYPFYEDGYKLVEAPHLGMEHQSAIAYGNKFENGYKGIDRWSETGWGLKWDFIIVHESGHEWFANSITTADIADLWIHESFTCYSEVLYTEFHFGRKAADEYHLATRKNIKNDVPVIGNYGVNSESGTLDCYYKGSAMIHTLRMLMNNDKKFRRLLLDMNRQYFHSIVNSAQIENYISKKIKKNLRGFFDQYLRNTKIPVLEYRFNKNILEYRYVDCVENFSLPLKVNGISKNKFTWIYPDVTWKTFKLPKGNDGTQFRIDPGFYIKTKKSE